MLHMHNGYEMCMVLQMFVTCTRSTLCTQHTLYNLIYTNTIMSELLHATKQLKPEAYLSNTQKNYIQTINKICNKLS
jgi:hypothetical protein